MGKNRNVGIGKRAERAIAEILTKITGLVFMRNPYSGSAHAWGYIKELQQRGDVICKDKSFHYCISSKRIKNFQLESLLRGSKEILKHWDECINDALADEKQPLLIITSWRGERIAIMQQRDLDRVHINKLVNYSGILYTDFVYSADRRAAMAIMRLQLWAKLYKGKFL